MSLTVVQTFNANGTFTAVVPVGTTSIIFEVWGGGGSGGGRTTVGYGGGAAGGCYAKTTQTGKIFGSTLTVVVGDGGTAGAGGSTSSVKWDIDNSYPALAIGGAGVANNVATGAVGALGVTAGDVIYRGGGGATGSAGAGGGGGGGEGAATTGNGSTAVSVSGGSGTDGGDGGSGRVAGLGQGNGVGGSQPGGGGGGAFMSSVGSFTGGRGGGGQVKISWVITNGVLSPIDEFF